MAIGANKPIYPSDARFRLHALHDVDTPWAVVDTHKTDGRNKVCYIREDGAEGWCSEPTAGVQDAVVGDRARSWSARTPVWTLPSAARTAVCLRLHELGATSWDARSLGFADDAECDLIGADAGASDPELVRAWNDSKGVVSAANSIKMRPEDLWRRALHLRDRGHVLRAHRYGRRKRRGAAKKTYFKGGMPPAVVPFLGREPDRVIAESLRPQPAVTTVASWRKKLGVLPYRGRQRPKDHQIDLATGLPVVSTVTPVDQERLVPWSEPLSGVVVRPRGLR